MTVRAERRPMTADEITMATALGFSRVLPGTPDKAFVGVMAACARDPAPAITERQALYLRICIHRYRRQLQADVVALAGPAPSKQTLAVAATPSLHPDPVRAMVPPQLSLL